MSSTEFVIDPVNRFTMQDGVVADPDKMRPYRRGGFVPIYEAKWCAFCSLYHHLPFNPGSSKEE